MRRSIGLLIAIAMIVTIGAAGAISVSAAEIAKADHRTLGEALKDRPGKQQEAEEYMPNAALVMFRSTKATSEKSARRALRSGEKAIGDLQIEELWNYSTAEDTAVSEDGVRKALNKRGKGGTYHAVALVKSKTLSTKELIQRLQARDDVLYAEPNYRITAYNVNDPYFSRQWSMQGSAASPLAQTPNIGALWDEGVTGSERIVAVVDTGVDYTHPDLADNMWHNEHQPVLEGEYGFDFNAGDDDPMDEHGHGTHCAGIIGACGNNGTGISGVNQNIRIMALRILNEQGSAYLSHELAAYHYINIALDLGEPVAAINNSWGGGEESRIFRELVDTVGEKGAITVCAAGNDGSDNDEDPQYPANIDSPYLISVAATREDGELVSFSNYGKESVDVAAPGTDILSTVSYDCYDASAYGDTQDEVSAAFNDYESGDEAALGSVKSLNENLYLNGKPYTGEEGQPAISIEDSEGGFQSDHALQIRAEKLKADDVICAVIPYEIDEDATIAPSFSVMERCSGTSDEIAVMEMLDVPQGTGMSPDELSDGETLAEDYVFSEEMDYWNHLTFETLDQEELKDLKKEAAGLEEGQLDPLKREIVILIYALGDGNLKMQLDNMGMSRQDLPGTESFGKYDHYSGTSMATPYISGAIALKAEALAGQLGEEPDSEMLVNELVSCAKEGKMPILMRGAFDFTKRPAELGPRVGAVKVNQKAKTITIRGTSLTPSDGPLKVEIGPDPDSLTEAEIISNTDREVVIRDNNWINNVEYIRVTGFGGKTSSRPELYLVNGKGEYTMLEGVMDETTGEAMATDGRRIFNAASADKMIRVLDTKNLRDGADILCEIDPKTLFSAKQNKKARYAMKFGSDLVYMNDMVYSVVKYGQADEAETPEEDFWFFGQSTGSASDMYLDEEGNSSMMTIYSGDYRLIGVNVKSRAVTNFGALPKDLLKTADYTMAGYNGKLYFIGGYSFADKKVTNKVRVFNPAAAKNKRWSNGASLPAGRAGGKAVQSGSQLVYTLGYDASVQGSEDELLGYRCPSNLIFNGKKWTASRMDQTKNVEPLVVCDTVTRGGEKHAICQGDVSLTGNGLVYTGVPAAGYGDTFLYNAGRDVYTDTGINFITDIDDIEISGIAVGNRIYGFDGENVFTAPVKSPLITVKAARKGKGRVTGAGSYMPGNNATIKIKAKKGSVIKSIKVNGKTIKVKKKAKKKTIVLKQLTKNQNVKVVFKKAKKAKKTKKGKKTKK